MEGKQEVLIVTRKRRKKRREEHKRKVLVERKKKVREEKQQLSPIIQASKWERDAATDRWREGEVDGQTHRAR